MPPVFLRSSFGGVSFWITSLSGRGGRDVVVQSPASGDTHVLQDRGRRHRATTCELLFVDEPEKGTSDERFREFSELVGDGESHLFTHPIEGTFLARVTEFDYRVTADGGEITASCTFLPESDQQAVFPAGVGTAPSAGLDEVSATVSATNEQLVTQGLSSDVPNDTLSRVKAWTEAETPDTRALYLEASSLSQRISAEVDRLELLSSFERWPLYREFIMLQFQMRRAAESVTTAVSRTFEVTVAEDAPLRTICAQLYGGAAADERAREVASANGIRRPGLVPAGTRLQVPREGAR